MEIIVREICDDDYATIHSLIANELGYGNSSLKDVCKRLEAIGKRVDYKTMVALCDGRAVGFVGMCKGIAYEMDGEYLRIIALAVESSYQNRGVGTKLIEAAERYARSENVKSIALSSGLQRTNAHLFYEKRGFTKYGYSFSKKLPD